MTQVFPISNTPTTSTTTSSNGSTGSTDNSQVTQDMFLKLLVAQMKYQDPLSPADGTQFLTQTAQFTTLETLQKIESEQSTLSKSTQVLQAASMVGRSVTYSLTAGNQTSPGPTPTSVISIRGSLPKDAAVGAKADATTDVFTKSGQKVPLTLEFTKTADGWNVQAMNSGHAISDPIAVNFDASGDHTTGDLSIPSSALNNITGTAGSWPATGITLGFGAQSDATRLQLGSGPATVTVAEQDGNDGNTATGIVTGIHMTADGPSLVIGGKDIPLANISDVNT